MKLDLGPWMRLWSSEPFVARADLPAFAGVSFGRTSAFMAALLTGTPCVFCFENTGREHPKTYEFGERLEDALQHEIVWLEWRPPPQVGDPPRLFSFERVTHRTAAKKGEPFRGMLEALAAYRKTIGKGPLRRGRARAFARPT